MTTHIVTDTDSLREAGNQFLDELEKAMTRGQDSKSGIVSAMDKLYDILTNVNASFGYCVRMDPTLGTTFDIFDGYEKTDWNDNLFNSDWDFTNLQFFSPEKAAESFLSVLGYQILNNVPEAKDEAIRHMKLHVASMFNGANRFNVKFELIFIDYSVFEGEYAETIDLGDQLLVA